jgi:DNA modification methylase
VAHLLQGHVLEVLAELPAESVQCVVTSPPYWGLRDYKLPAQVWGGDRLARLARPAASFFLAKGHPALLSVSWVPAERSVNPPRKEVIQMRKPASATVVNSQPIAAAQLQLVAGGTDPVVVIVPNPPSLKAERVQ